MSFCHLPFRKFLFSLRCPILLSLNIKGVSLGFTHVCSLVNKITPWPKVFGMFIVSGVIQFTCTGCTGPADDYHVITDAVVFHVA